jgi:ABC-type transport system substrate-binding protein
VDDVAGVFLQKTILGDFDGTNDAPITPFEELDHSLFAILHSSSPRVSPLIKDSQLDDLVQRQRTTTDEAQRISHIHEIQRIVADNAYYIFHPAGLARAGAQARVKNYFVVPGNNAPAESFSKLWLQA